MKRNGYSLVEVLASLAIFAIFLLVLVSLQRSFVKYDREMRVQMFSHPAPLAVLARLQRDVLDSTSYPESHEDWTQTPETLILAVPGEDGSRIIVWDFTSPATVRRLEYDDADAAEWVARAVPDYQIGSYEMPDGRVAVRVRSFDEKGRLSVDRFVLPRAR